MLQPMSRDVFYDRNLGIRFYLEKDYRLKTHDYTRKGFYFITIGTYFKESLFGEIHPTKIALTPLGNKVDELIPEISKYNPHIRIDCSVVMPDHVHILLEIKYAISQRRQMGTIKGMKYGSVSYAIRNFKSAVTRWSRKNGHAHYVWQRRFHDSVVRDGDKGVQAIRDYIKSNPAKAIYKYNNPRD